MQDAIFIFIATLIGVLVGGWAAKNDIADDCEYLQRFKANGVVYECVEKK